MTKIHRSTTATKKDTLDWQRHQLKVKTVMVLLDLIARVSLLIALMILPAVFLSFFSHPISHLVVPGERTRLTA